ncbi:plastocyanin/azurin family copper-binding protein [Rhodococcus sp. ARC_M6]|uniref:cupredoxin domain-containing protein n=1 Tax=Rhodococcus sp. ARC_M6 TaxID=2928852 RepID=UPI001FB32015|nr:plastocyanin/azurin family copper-binding protein [Rhodococcus sp. ARC_M6]MCJ0906414.1 plastocyanin/azurin family copper-binding protein [Rhodococcus sp. ARC_M6]
MKKLVPAFLAACAALSLTACSSESTASTEPAVVIEVKNMAYTPASVTIQKGQTVEWKFNDGGLPHDVVGNGALEGKLKSELLTEGTFSYTFDDAGTFTYHCTPHPMMVGTVIVQ